MVFFICEISKRVVKISDTVEFYVNIFDDFALYIYVRIAIIESNVIREKICVKFAEL